MKKRCFNVVWLAVVLSTFLFLQACTGPQISEEKSRYDQNRSEIQKEVSSQSDSIKDGNGFSEADIQSSEKENGSEPEDTPVLPDEEQTVREYLRAVEEMIEKQLETLTQQYEAMTESIDTIEKVEEGMGRLQEFCTQCIELTGELGIQMREAAYHAGEMLCNSDLSMDDRYDESEQIRKIIYDDISESISKAVYSGVLDDFQDDYYNGIIDDASDDLEYTHWSAISSEAYDMGSDAQTLVYRKLEDAASDIYAFYSDLSSAFYRSDMKKAEKAMQMITEEMEKAKGNRPLQAEILPSDSVDEAAANAMQEIGEAEETIQAAMEELKTNTYDFASFVENEDQVESFYETICLTNENLCLKIRAYAIRCAELILSESQLSMMDRYDKASVIMDEFYENCCEELEEIFYEDLPEEMMGLYYDGILDEAYDSVPYDQWSAAHSNEYDRWTDCRSKVYRDWSACRSELYGFCSDFRSALYRKNQEKAQKAVEQFRQM